MSDRNDWRKNIILPLVASKVESLKAEYEAKGEPFPLHQYLHHGLSSQAMLFNLLGDPYLKHDFQFFSELFNYPEVRITVNSELFFEYSDRITFSEKQQQPTSLDFAIKNNSGRNIFVESKYVEAEFGGCSSIQSGECDGLNPSADSDLCYLTHKDRTYWALMNKYGLSQIFAETPICPFSIYYQFYRELIFALEHNGYYVILYDKRNPAFYKTDGISERGLIPSLLRLIPAHLQSWIKAVTIQEVINILEKTGYSWTTIFREKYGMTK